MEFTFSKKTKLTTYVMMGIGAIAFIMGLFDADHNRFWGNILVNGFFFFAIALGALYFMVLQYATEAAWAVLVKRVFEGIMSFLPIGAIILLVVFLAGSFHWHHIYHWMDGNLYFEWLLPDGSLSHELVEGAVANPEYDAIIAGKKAYLNQPFFYIRTIAYLATFLYFANTFRKRSLLEDQVGGIEVHTKNYKKSAIFLVLFAVFSSTLSWDWIMSIDTHWFSTLFGWYVFSGMWVSAMIVAVIVTLYLKSKGYLPQVNNSHIHDLGKWMFAISFLWSYLWFSQFLLIWYSDIPEEVTYFVERIQDFKIPFFTMFFINFALPMVILMARDAKRNPKFLITIGTIIFLGHFMDTFLLVMPGATHHWHFGWMEVALFIGFLGLFINRVFKTLTKAPLTPANHPYLDESIHFNI